VLVFAGLVTLELALLAFVDTTTRPLDRSGAPFRLDNIAAGTVITQRLQVGANGFDEIRLDGGITTGDRAAMLHAQLVDITEAAIARAVRTTTVEVAPSATECCLIRFQPIADSRWRSYRLDLTVGELGGRRLSLWAAPGTINGQLTINGRPRVAFLVFRTRAEQGTGLGRLRRAPAAKTFALAALALICNAAVAATVGLLTTASDPRPS
jgi:hypothetical protein